MIHRLENVTMKEKVAMLLVCVLMIASMSTWAMAAENGLVLPHQRAC